jgi:cytochrome c oxidase subunit 2
MTVTLHRRRFLAGFLAAAAAAAGGAALAQKEEKIIRITARKFAFLPGEVTLKRGVPVTLELTSADVVMGFNAPDFGVRADIVPGQVSRLRLAPEKTGTFVFLCDIFCGDGHEGMSGKLHVVA